MEKLKIDALEIKRQLHNFIEVADDNKLKGIYLLLEDDISLAKAFSLSPQQIQLLEEEREKHLSGDSKSYSWDDVKQFVRRNTTA